MSDPLNEVEAKNAMRDLAAMTWAFYSALRDEGFKTGEALTITCAWINTMASAQPSEEEE